MKRRPRPRQALGRTRVYAAVRKDTSRDRATWIGGKAAWVDALTIGYLPADAQRLAIEEDARRPDWARRHPVQRIAAFSLTER